MGRKAYMSEAILFVLIAAGMVIVFYSLLRYLATYSEKRDNALFQDLAIRTGFQYLKEGGSEFRKLTEGMLDFGLSTLQPERIVLGQHSLGKVVLFDADDESFLIGTDSHRPIWSGCLIQTSQLIKPEMIIYRIGIDPGVLRKYKKVPFQWSEVELGGKLKGYVLKSPNVGLCRQLLNDGLDQILLNCANEIKGGMLPRALALQVMGDRIAVYSDQRGLEVVEHYLKVYGCAVDALKVLRDH